MSQLALLPSKKPPTIYVYNETISMCFGFPGLLEIVEKYWQHKKLDTGSMYIFVNKKQTYCKILFWAKGGLCILAKKLERGHFRFDLDSKTIEITDLNKKLDVK